MNVETLEVSGKTLIYRTTGVCYPGLSRDLMAYMCTLLVTLFVFIFVNGLFPLAHSKRSMDGFGLPIVTDTNPDHSAPPGQLLIGQN